MLLHEVINIKISDQTNLELSSETEDLIANVHDRCPLGVVQYFLSMK